MPGPIAAATGRSPGARSASSARSTIPRRDAAPAAVDHRDRARRRERQRDAVGDQHERRQVRGGGRPARPPARAPRRARARSRTCDVGAVHLPAHRDPCRHRGRVPPASSARLRRTRAGSSSVRIPRLSDSYGPSLAPPSRVLKAARAPASGASSQARSPSLAPLERGRDAGRLGRRAHVIVSRTPSSGVRCAYSKWARPSDAQLVRLAPGRAGPAALEHVQRACPRPPCCSSRRDRRRGRDR